jgi:hypothetical protein
MDELPAVVISQCGSSHCLRWMSSPYHSLPSINFHYELHFACRVASGDLVDGRA